MPGSRELTEAHAPSAAQARINLAWGLLLVKAVPLIQSLHLAVSQTPHVIATPGTRGETEVNALSAVSTNIKKAWVLVLA